MQPEPVVARLIAGRHFDWPAHFPGYPGANSLNQLKQRLGVASFLKAGGSALVAAKSQTGRSGREGVSVRTLYRAIHKLGRSVRNRKMQLLQYQHELMWTLIE